MRVRDEVRNIVVVLPNGKEYFSTIHYRVNGPGSDRSSTLFDYREAAENAVRNEGIRTSRKNPQSVCVKTFNLEIVNGELKRRSVLDYDVMPPFESMTEGEFAEEQNTILVNIPIEFHSFVCKMAWDYGHSSGFEEVINYTRELVDNLQPCVENFRKNIESKK